MSVNVDVPEPDPPGPWIEITEWTPSGNVKNAVCVCGDHYAVYKSFRSKVSYNLAADELRQLNQERERRQGYGLGGGWLDDKDPGGGFRSRGPVLWMMHVLKLRAFYAEHDHCKGFDDEDAWDDFCATWPDAENCIGFDEWVQAGRPTSDQELIDAGLIDPRDDDDDDGDDDDDSEYYQDIPF